MLVIVWWVVDGRLLAVLGAVGAGDDDCAAGVGDETAIQKVEGVRDPA